MLGGDRQGEQTPALSSILGPGGRRVVPRGPMAVWLGPENWSQSQETEGGIQIPRDWLLCPEQP